MAKPVAPEDRERGDRLRALRESKGWTQEQAAERAGQMARTDYNRLESGRNKGSSAAMRKRLAQAFGISIEKISALLEGLLTPSEALAVERPVVVPVQVNRVELEPRYPNLVEAMRELEGKLSPATVEHAWSIALHSPADLEIALWSGMLLDFERKLRRQAKTGESIGDEVTEENVPPRGKR